MWRLRLLMFKKGEGVESALKRVSGMSRLFLLCFLYQFDKERASCTFEEYAEIFRLSCKRIGQIVQELEDAGIVLISKQQGVDHRPKSFIHVDGKFIDELKASFEDCSVDVDEGLIRDVAFGELVPAEMTNLKPLNRLLLCVLLVHSSEVGRVDGLGQSALRELTGFSVDQRRSQISRLADLGFIRALVPGVTGCYLFGSVKTRYFLNMGHLGFGEYARHETLLVGRWFSGDDDYRSGQAEAILKGAKEANRLISRIIHREGKKLTDREYKDLLRVIRFEQKWGVKAKVPDRESTSWEAELSGRLSGFFQDASIKHDAPYLQVKINEYASQLVLVPEEQLLVRENGLRKKIALDFLRGKRRGEWAAFVSAVLTASRVQASRARLLLNGLMQEIDHKGKGEAADNADFVILPTLETDPKSGLIVTLCVSSKEESSMVRRPYWDQKVVAVRGGEFTVVSSAYADASFLEEKMQLTCGLKAKAKQYPKRPPEEVKK